MDLKRLKYFCAIVEQGQLTRAAEILHISQSPLSQRLKELEDDLGVALFHRDGRKMTPTEAGLELYEQAKAIFRQVDTARATVIATASEQAEQLRIGFSPTCTAWFKVAFQEIQRELPTLQLSVACFDSSNLEQMLNQRQIDIALMQRPMRTDLYHVEDLPSTPLVAVVNNRATSASAERELSLSHLSELPILLLRRSAGGGTYEQILKTFRQNHLPVRVPAFSPNVNVLVDLLETGFYGAAIIPATEALNQKLTACTVHPLQFETCMYHPAIAWLSASTPSRATRKIVDILKSTRVHGTVNCDWC